MYASIFEIGRRFFGWVCEPSDAIAHSCDPKTGALAMGLRPEVGHAER